MEGVADADKGDAGDEGEKGGMGNARGDLGSGGKEADEDSGHTCEMKEKEKVSG